MSVIVRDRCIRCNARIQVPSDAVPSVTVIAGKQERRGFRCSVCTQQAQHISTCAKAVHVERWPT